MKIPVLVFTLLLFTPSLIFAGGSGHVALQTGDPSCGDDSGNIYVDCGNGTVTDNRTSLIWLADASCLSSMTDWDTAKIFVASLSDLDDDFCTAEGVPSQAICDCSLSDNSSPGEWRLPTADEWKLMVSDALGVEGDPNCTLSPPTLTNDSGGGCQISGPSSFFGVMTDYWSISVDMEISINNRFSISLSDGEINRNTVREALLYAWPVRGGQ